MANADFSRQQNQPTGGFDASSYRAAAPAEEEVRLTPFQQKLASLEKALPAALSKQAVAVALCIVVMLGCFVGFSGAKLRAKYDTVKNGFTTGVAADSGYTLNEELTTRLPTSSPPRPTHWVPTAPKCRRHRLRWTLFPPASGRCSPMARFTHRTL